MLVKVVTCGLSKWCSLSELSAVLHMLTSYRVGKINCKCGWSIKFQIISFSVKWLFTFNLPLSLFLTHTLSPTHTLELQEVSSSPKHRNISESGRPEPTVSFSFLLVCKWQVLKMETEDLKASPENHWRHDVTHPRNDMRLKMVQGAFEEQQAAPKLLTSLSAVI